MNSSAADLKVQGFQIKSFKKGNRLPICVYFLLFRWKQVAWLVSRLHRAKEHSVVDHFTEGWGCAGYWKLHSSECFLFPRKLCCSLFSIFIIWFLKKWYFLGENQAILNVFFCCWNFSELVTYPCSHETYSVYKVFTPLWLFMFYCFTTLDHGGFTEAFKALKVITVLKVSVWKFSNWL